MLVVAVLLFVVVDFLARRLVRCSPFVEDDLRVVDLLLAVVVDDDLLLLVDRFLRFEPKSSTIIAEVVLSSVELSLFCCCFLLRFIF